jgi:hypothetical protein
MAGKRDKAFADPFDQLTRCEIKKFNRRTYARQHQLKNKRVMGT